MVLVFHILDDAELTFPYDRLTRFKDMEGVGRLTANPKALRNRYLARIHTFLECTAKELRARDGNGKSEPDQPHERIEIEAHDEAATRELIAKNGVEVAAP